MSRGGSSSTSSSGAVLRHRTGEIMMKLTDITVARAIVAPAENVLAVKDQGRTWHHYGRFLRVDRPRCVEYTWMSKRPRASSLRTPEVIAKACRAGPRPALGRGLLLSTGRSGTRPTTGSRYFPGVGEFGVSRSRHVRGAWRPHRSHATPLGCPRRRVGTSAQGCHVHRFPSTRSARLTRGVPDI